MRDMNIINILVYEGGQSIRVDDFGLQKYLDYVILKYQRQKREYKISEAPEAFIDRYDPQRSDVWSMGVILYWILFGQPPFRTKDPARLYERVVSNVILYPSDVRVISDQCLLLLQSMLQRELTQRITWKELCEHPYIRLAF